MSYWFLSEYLSLSNLTNQDWFHESCCNLRTRPTSREPTPQPEQSETQANGEDNEDAVSEASSSGLPPPLISASEYESFICGSCVSNIETLKKWAGTRGAMMVVRNSTTEPWRCLNGDTQHPEELVTVDDSSTQSASSAKRPLSPSLAHEPDAKRARGSSSSSTTSPLSTACIAPPRNPYAQKLFEDGISFDLDRSLGTGDVFLTDGSRERWCRCHAASFSFLMMMFVLTTCWISVSPLWKQNLTFWRKKTHMSHQTILIQVKSSLASPSPFYLVVDNISREQASP